MEGPITLPSALVQADSRLCGPPSDAPVWRAARAHAAWAVRHGVKYLPSCITHCAHPELGPRHPSWCKMVALADAMDTRRYSKILWLDAGVIWAEPTRGLGALLAWAGDLTRLRSPHAFFGCAEAPATAAVKLRGAKRRGTTLLGPASGRRNNGDSSGSSVILLRSDEVSRTLMQTWWDGGVGKKEGPRRSFAWNSSREQAILRWVVWRHACSRVSARRDTSPVRCHDLRLLSRPGSSSECLSPGIVGAPLARLDGGAASDALLGSLAASTVHVVPRAFNATAASEALFLGKPLTKPVDPAVAIPKDAAGHPAVLWHYHAFTKPTPKPSAAELRAAERPGAPPARAAEVVFALVGSCVLADRLRAADRTWCSAHHHPGISCQAYVECEEPMIDGAPFRPESLRVVRASEYLVPYHTPGEQCCDVTQDYTNPHEWDGLGPSTYYCEETLLMTMAMRRRHPSKHRVRTLPAQYRFLPALHHARTEHLAAFRSGALKWLCLVDDDSWVSVPALLALVGRHNHDVPLQLGEFVPAHDENATHWRRPFACGGAGTVLSRAAVLATDSLPACMRSFNQSCQQSDWMIGRCLERAGVQAFTGLSCGVCAAYKWYSRPGEYAKLTATRTRLLEGRCGFLQFTNNVHELFGPGTSQTWLLYAMASPAIVHWQNPRSPFFTRCGTQRIDAIGAAATNDARPDADRGGWPQLMVVGAQKAATSSLFDRLRAHPGYCEARQHADEERHISKEKHFFDDERRCAAGAAFYTGYFARGRRRSRRPCHFFADGTPLIAGGTSLRTLLIAPIVFYTIPPAALPKLVALLREPTERMYSWYYHLRAPSLHAAGSNESCDAAKAYTRSVLWMCMEAGAAWGAGAVASASGDQYCAHQVDSHQVVCFHRRGRAERFLSFAQWVVLHGHEQLPAGVYAPQVAMWRAYFGSRLLLLSFDDLTSRDPERTLQRVASHAGIGPFPEGKLRLRTMNTRTFKQMEGMTQAQKREIEDGVIFGGADAPASAAARCEGLPCDVQRRVVDYYEPHNRALYASEPEFPPFELGCCDATADTTVHLLPCLTSFQGGADKKGSPKRCEMVAAGTAAG